MLLGTPRVPVPGVAVPVGFAVGRIGPDVGVGVAVVVGLAVPAGV
jgi:hypothetical protein